MLYFTKLAMYPSKNLKIHHEALKEIIKKYIFTTKFDLIEAISNE